MSDAIARAPAICGGTTIRAIRLFAAVTTSGMRSPRPSSSIIALTWWSDASNATLLNSRPLRSHDHAPEAATDMSGADATFANVLAQAGSAPLAGAFTLSAYGEATDALAQDQACLILLYQLCLWS